MKNNTYPENLVEPRGHLGDMRLISRVPPGTCPDCATAHDPQQPHNQQSLFYKYKFFNQHGRWPTWADAMAHCPKEIKDFWIRELKERGVDIGKEPGESAPDESHG